MLRIGRDGGVARDALITATPPFVGKTTREDAFEQWRKRMGRREEKETVRRNKHKRKKKRRPRENKKKKIRGVGERERGAGNGSEKL
jgi:hypothetical protein